MAVLLGVSNGITVAASKVAEKTVIDPNSIQTTEDISYHISTRQLSDHDFDEERARRIGGGDAMATNNDTPSNQVYGTHTSIGLMNSNGVTHDGECNRFTNWWKRLFNKSIKKCDEEDTRRLRS
ncbi:hypothetical protein F441_03913 [Phytophthora nicotianae CJ01A1]|nr:hypothetical protein PPTG_07995 [Phytophthora nicotianae INRA-310]ETK92901.1 hypothetical protein L915_03824 [Phytophthora nicotianae]ETP22876.1 hypothetical protein F441_03913 [Phytophthora nicotianae CJ01A1]ETP50854.1 hypothetical protein F442_03920 [Phytophthora nicotianae P10297]ETK92931.1 hypothetical protein L915_03823 [Phytophthora nicotianae]ETL46328.1 hypothetical protein L916_03765 [Phytophthora nicotianae]